MEEFMQQEGIPIELLPKRATLCRKKKRRCVNMRNPLTKHERFVKVVKKRMNTIIDNFEKLGNCASEVS